MNQNRLRLKVGLFIIFLLINAIGIIYYILLSKGTFEKRYDYFFTTHSAEALNVGMPVKVSGFTIGRVDVIELLDDGTVKLTFSVNEQNQKWVNKESLLMIRKPLLGSSYIILYSAIGNPVLKEGSTLEALISNDINDLVLKLEPIVLKMGNIVNSVDKITTYLAKDDSELMLTIKNIEKFTAVLVQNKSLLTSLTGDEKATNAFINTIKTLPSIVEKFNKISSNVDKSLVPKLSEFMNELIKITEDINTKLKTLDGIVNSVGASDKDLIQIKDQIKTGIAKSNEIIQKVDSLFIEEDNKKVVLP